MAQTKVKLISDGVIVQGNLHASHGITTAHIGEGSNLYYTDARVGSYLSTNGYATQTDIVAAITDSAPVTLDTLNELAAALGDDPNFATTTATSLGLKAPLASPSFTGNATFAGSVTGQTNSNTFGTASASGRALIVQAGSSNQAIMLKNNLGGDGTISVTGTATTMNYSFGTYSVAPALFIQNDGNVGIGTSSPNSYSNQTTLTINGTSYGRLDLESGGTLRSSLFSQAANTTLAVSTGFFSIDVGSERLRIDTSGNVGIGVTGPDAKLQIKGTGATSGLTFKTTDSSNNETFYIKDGGVVGVRYYPFKIGVPSETANVANTRFQIATTAGDFVVLNDGKTGIGTTDPEQKLHVEGASITVNRGNDDSSIAFQNSTSNATWRIGRDYSNSEALTFAYSATDYPSLTGNGLISINTSGALTVSTAASTIATFKATGSGQNEKQLIIDTGGNRVILDAQTTAGANTNLVFQEGGGNVGIGTTSPDQKLQVNGSIKIANTNNRLVFGTAGGTDRRALEGNTSGSLLQVGEGYTNIVLQGDVGIGTTSPGAKLEVKEGHTILGGTQNNYGGNVFTTKLGGYGVLSTGTDRYGSYGWLTFNSNNNYTGAARGFAFTNGYKTNEFALLMGTSDQAPPTLGAQGVVTNGQLIFHVNNSADFMFGKVAGDGNGPHLQINSYGYSSTFQGSSTSNMVTYKTGTELNTNVGALVFRDNGNDYCGQITVNGATNTTSYLSASDYRLKEDLKSFDGMSLLEQIQVYDFKWKKENVRTFGVLAHELKEVLPLVVDGDKDEEKYQTVDYSKIVPVLIKSIQELKAEIETLKTQING